MNETSELVTCPACHGRTIPGDGTWGCNFCEGEGTVEATERAAKMLLAIRQGWSSWSALALAMHPRAKDVCRDVEAACNGRSITASDIEAIFSKYDPTPAEPRGEGREGVVLPNEPGAWFDRSGAPWLILAYKDSIGGYTPNDSLAGVRWQWQDHLPRGGWVKAEPAVEREELGEPVQLPDCTLYPVLSDCGHRMWASEPEPRCTNLHVSFDSDEALIRHLADELATLKAQLAAGAGNGE